MMEDWEFCHLLSEPCLHQQIDFTFSSEHFFVIRDTGCTYTRKDAALIFDIYKRAEYDNFQEALSVSLQKAIPQIHKNIVGAKNGLFCDVPMIHLWLELIINQYGSPYHFNMKNHKRYTYAAKTRDMYIDIFTFDRCRALYDWLPMIEYYGEDLSILERQLIARMCIDAIGKHTIFNLHQQYFGSALIGYNEREWSRNYYIPLRQRIH